MKIIVTIPQTLVDAVEREWQQDAFEEIEAVIKYYYPDATIVAFEIEPDTVH